MVHSILFGLGAGLFFMGLFYQSRTSRFKEDLREKQRSDFLGLFRPLLYLPPLQCLIKSRKSFSRMETQLLLERAGRPRGLTAEHIILARLLLPFVATAILKIYIKHRERRVMAEQGLFSEILFMSLQARLNLREALEEAAKTTDYLQPYLRVCLNEWPNDRIRALHNLKRNVGVLSFSMVVDLLLQAAGAGDEKIAQFLEENKKLEDEIRNLEITARNKTKPLLMTVQMIVPLLVILIILFYPLSVQVEGLINTFF